MQGGGGKGRERHLATWPTMPGNTGMASPQRLELRVAPSGLRGPHSGHPDTSLPGAAPSCQNAHGSPPAQTLTTEGDPQSEGGGVWVTLP